MTGGLRRRVAPILTIHPESGQYLARGELACFYGSEDIAISRHIDRASIKPRLRIMSEVQRDGNPHTYSEIPACTANLIVKPAIEDFLSETEWVCRGVEWFSEQAKAEELTLQSADSQNIVFTLGEEVVPVAVRSIQHRRNGRHLVLQYQL